MIQINSQEQWAVVGGGFLGMTLGPNSFGPTRKNCQLLYESAPSLGGLASAWQLGDIIWDRHYHVTLSSDAHLLSLLRELGLEKEMHWERARTGFYVDSEFYSMSNTLGSFCAFHPLIPIDKFRLGVTIFHASRIKNWKSLEKIPVKDWLEKWSGPTVTEKIWLPLLRAKLGDNYRDTSAAFIWATIARMYAARRSGMKTELFGYVLGGYARTVHQFEQVLQKARVNCRLGQPVVAVTSRNSGKLQIELANGSSENL